MPTAYELGRRWVRRESSTVGSRLDAALELAYQMRPLVAARNVSMTELFDLEPLLGIKLAEDAGVVSIAARHRLDKGDVMEALGFLISISRPFAEVP